jgi:L-ornithine Nalpha-acyltransferase
VDDVYIAAAAFGAPLEVRGTPLELNRKFLNPKNLSPRNFSPKGLFGPKSLVGRFKTRSPNPVKRFVARFRPRSLKGLPGLPFGLLPFRRKKSKRFPFFPGRLAAKVYGMAGGLEARLARTRGDLHRAQKLRYQVFYEEMAAIPDAKAIISGRDVDLYDPICDHLLVVDHGVGVKQQGVWRRRPRVVGTYRFLLQDAAENARGFYTQGEYDIAPLLAEKGKDNYFMELGRSCVLKSYRNKRTVELLWHGVWTYIRENQVDVMLGCASFPGADPAEHALALSFLYQNRLAPEEWRVKAHPHRHVDMNMLPPEKVDARAALKAMPTLIKGYLRLGAYVGDGAVVDQQFGTTDVFIILPVTAIDARYFAHFGAPGETVAALDSNRMI